MEEEDAEYEEVEVCSCINILPMFISHTYGSNAFKLHCIFMGLCVPWFMRLRQ